MQIDSIQQRYGASSTTLDATPMLEAAMQHREFLHEIHAVARLLGRPFTPYEYVQTVNDIYQWLQHLQSLLAGGSIRESCLASGGPGNTRRG